MIATESPRAGAPRRLLACLGLALLALGLSASQGCTTVSQGTPEAKELLNAGLEAYDKEDYKTAAEKMELALKLDPIYALCEAHLGLTYHRMGFSDKGIKECDQAIKLYEDVGEGWNNKGEILLDLKRYDEAKKCFDEAAEITLSLPPRARDDVHFSPNYNLGRLYEARKENDKALKAYLTCIDNNPRHVNAHLAAGILYLRNNVLKDAEQHFKLALEFAPGHPVANYGLAKIALKGEQWEESIMRLRDAIDKDPKNKDYLKLLSEVLRKSPPRVAITLVKMAEKPIDDGKTDEAIGWLNAAEKIDPDNIEVYIMKAQAYLTAKPRRVEEMKAAAKKGYAKDPKNPRIRFQLGLALLAGGELKPSEDLLRGLRREYPTRRKAPPPSSADIRKYLGSVFFKEKQYRRAEIEWREGQKLAPDDETFKKNIEAVWATPGVRKSNELNEKGGKALAEKNYDDAKDGFQTAIELDDNFAVAWANLALLYYETGNLKDARRAAKNAIERDPDLGKAHLFLGMIEEKENHLDAALKSYEEASELSKEMDPEPHYALGKLLVKKGKMAEAEKAFLLALEIYPDHCRSSYELGKLYLAKGQVDKASARFKIATGSCPDFALPYVSLAQLCIQLKKFEEALKYLEKSFALDPAAPEPLMGFALCKKAMGEPAGVVAYAYLEAAARYTAKAEFTEAVTACRSALENAPRAPKTDQDKVLLARCHDDLGVALMQTGAFTESLDELQKAVDLDPNQGNLEYLFHVGQCYQQKGDRKRAVEQFVEILRKNPGMFYAQEVLGDMYDVNRSEADNYMTLGQAIKYLEDALKLEPNDDRKAMIRQKLEELRNKRKQQ